MLPVPDLQRTSTPVRASRPSSCRNQGPWRTIRLLALVVLGLNATAHAQVFPVGWVAPIIGAGPKSSRDVVVDPFGDVIIAGDFTYALDFDPGPGDETITADGNTAIPDVFLQKLHPDGSFVRAGKINGPQVQQMRGLAVDAAGHVILCGRFEGLVDLYPGSGVQQVHADPSWDHFIVKLTADGTYVWGVRLNTGSYDLVNSIAVGADGRIYLTGTFIGTMDVDPGPDQVPLTSADGDAFVIALEPDGSFLAAGRMGGFQDDGGTSITVDPSGQVLVTGTFTTAADLDPTAGNHVVLDTAGTQAGFLVRLTGELQFVQATPLVAASSVMAGSIGTDAQGNAIVLGAHIGSMDLDPGPGMQLHTPAAVSSGALHVLKFTPAGDLLWGVALDSLELATGGSHLLAVDQDGHAIFAAALGASATLGGFHLVGHGLADIAVVELDALGTPLKAFSIGGDHNDRPSGITVGPDNVPYLTGTFSYQVDFDPGPGVLEVFQSQVDPAVFTLRLGPAPVGVVEATSHLAHLAPCPAVDAVWISGVPNLAGHCSVVDAHGRIVMHGSWTANNPLVVSHLAPGAYTVVVAQDGAPIARGRFLKL